MAKLLVLLGLAGITFLGACKSGSSGGINSPQATATFTQICRAQYCCNLGDCDGGDEGLCVPRCVKYHKGLGGMAPNPGVNPLKSTNKNMRNFMKLYNCMGPVHGMCIGKPLSGEQCAEIKACLRKLP